jgi:transcriptional regulator with XRE-family HTH domain
MSETSTISADVPTWTLGNRLWRARRHVNLTQQQLAERLGVGLKSIKEYESDRRRPKRAVLLGWAVQCQVDPRWLEHGAGEPDSESAVTTRSSRELVAA